MSSDKKIEISASSSSSSLQEEKNNKKNKDESTICPICQDELKNPTEHESKTTRTSCGHMFHSHCIEKWIEMRNLCPVCNQVADDKKPVRQLESEDELSNQLIRSLLSSSVGGGREFWTRILSGNGPIILSIPSISTTGEPFHNPNTCSEQTQCACCYHLSCAHLMKRCSGCHQIIYCDESCQHNHWQEHREWCMSNRLQ